MQVDREAAGHLVQNILDMGEMLLSSGAEVKRVEDTLSRMGAACGAEKVNIFVITASIMATMEFSGGVRVTQIRRISRSPKYDFRRLEALNRLSRECCTGGLLRKSLHKGGAGGTVLEKKLRVWKQGENIRERYLGSLLVTGSFAVYFGGNLSDGLAAAAFAPLICFLQNRFEPFCPNKVTFYSICSFVAGILICVFSRWTGMFRYDRVIMGDMMLLLPGLALMNSVRDVLAGNTISGIMRLTESLIWTGALVVGFMGAIWVVI